MDHGSGNGLPGSDRIIALAADLTQAVGPELDKRRELFPLDRSGQNDKSASDRS